MKCAKSLDPVQLFVPVLLQDESRNSCKECAHKAIEGPPVVLQNEAPKDDESTQRVVDEHHLGRSSQNPIQQLQQEKPFWENNGGNSL